MSLFDKLKNKRSSLQEKKDDEIKKPTKKANKEVFDVTGKSAARDAKKYSSGEYPKIGGGERMSPKSKGPGASTGGTKIPPATVGGKSKGATPVKVNITKPIKQSEVSNKAKAFTKDINKKRTKKVFPGDKSGAYKQAKDDLEARKGFKKNKPGGLKADEKNPFVKRSVRKTRVDKLGGDIYDAPKFSQKGFEKSLLPKSFKSLPKSVFDKSLKPIGRNIPGSAKSPQIPLIPDPFGKGDTPGQQKVKAMDKRAFKVTQPKDIKLPKSFTDFSKKLKTYKTDVAKTSSSTPRTVTKKFTPTVGVKQSEVSKKAQEFTKNINQQRQTTTPSKSDVKRIKQNKIDTQKADAFKKTAAYKNIAQGTDAQGNYLTPEQRKANFIKRTKQNKEPKEIKNKSINKRVDAGTSKTKKGNVVTQGTGQGSRTSVTMNKDAAQALRNPSKVSKVKDVKLGSKSFKNIMPKMKKVATPAAKAFSKAGPVGKLAAAALVAGGAIYGYNQIRKTFAGAGKPKAPPAVKGSALRYTSGPKKGQKKYFDIKTMKRDYFTPSDFRDKEGNIDAGFGKPDRDEKLIKRLRSTK